MTIIAIIAILAILAIILIRAGSAQGAVVSDDDRIAEDAALSIELANAAMTAEHLLEEVESLRTEREDWYKIARVRGMNLRQANQRVEDLMKAAERDRAVIRDLRDKVDAYRESNRRASNLIRAGLSPLAIHLDAPAHDGDYIIIEETSREDQTVRL